MEFGIERDQSFYQINNQDGLDLTVMEMIRHELRLHRSGFSAGQSFALLSGEIFSEFDEAKQTLNTTPKPIYEQVLTRLQAKGAEGIQLDEPCLSLDLTDRPRESFATTCNRLRKQFPHLKLLLASYFECNGTNLNPAIRLRVNALHLDLVRCPNQLDDMLQTDFVNQKTQLSLGVVDGRNIWINSMEKSRASIQRAIEVIGRSASLLPHRAH